MIVRAGSGWQTVLADLSLILFIITAAVLSGAGEGDDTAAGPSEQGEPLAIYSPELGAPPLRAWLAEQGADGRQQLTITVQYRPGGVEAALQRAEALVKDAGHGGQIARIVVEPGASGITAALAYDVPSEELARGLQRSESGTAAEEDAP